MTPDGRSPRVVVAAPLFNKAGYLREAAASLLDQTYGDLALLLVDDGSTDETLEVCRELAARDPRVHVYVNERRLGMLGNTRRAFALARERHPDAPYWALGSDHDLWHPRWLETLVGLLDSHPEAVLAYPRTRRIDEHGRPYPGAKPPWSFDTRGLADPRERFAAAFRGMAAGDMIYGLFRAEALARVGMYRAVLVPDRLLLSELALEGEFVQADEVLWQRRFRGLATLDRQRRAFFLDDEPRHARLPWWLQHSAAVLRHHGPRLAGDYLRLALALRYRRRRSRAHRVLRRYGPRRLARRWTLKAAAALGAWAGVRVRRLMRRPRFRAWGAAAGAPALRHAADLLDPSRDGAPEQR